jgi:hypothetical protein
VKVSVENKAAAASAGGDMVWRKNATMTNEKMDENDPLCSMPGFKCKWILDAAVSEERQAMSVEPEPKEPDSSQYGKRGALCRV